MSDLSNFATAPPPPNVLAMEPAVRAVHDAILRGRSLGETLSALLESVSLLGYPASWVALLEPDGTLRPVAACGMTDPAPLGLMRPDEGIGELVRRTVATGKAGTYEEQAAAVSSKAGVSQAESSLRCAAALPLVAAGQVLGALVVLGVGPDVFAPGALRQLEVVAVQAAVAAAVARRRRYLAAAARRGAPYALRRGAEARASGYAPLSPAERVWERRLRRALEEDRLVLYTQPILDLRAGRISQYELLVRLVDERGRLARPGWFLGVAERTGLVHALDREVVRRAIQLIAACASAGVELLLEVNLSALALENEQLLAYIRRQLRETGVAPERLVLEITETATVADIRQAQRFVASLREIGCRFALDDFGVGFGSLYHLKSLPVDFVKIDGEFIRRLHKDAADAHIVRAIVQLAEGLKVKTIAEFVQHARVAQMLRRLGVDYAQGFYVGRPRPVAHWLALGGHATPAHAAPEGDLPSP